MNISDADVDRIVCRPVEPSRWSDLERLFESKGAPSYCWCMAWRLRGKEAATADNAARKAEMKTRVEAGEPVGLLAYLDSEPVAWCSIAPRPTYRPLGGVEEPEREEGVWSLVCFYVKRELRGKGVSKLLIEAAIKHARGRGGHVVEAYPVEPDSPSYRFGGFRPVFERLGFRYCKDAGTRRKVMRVSI